MQILAFILKYKYYFIGGIALIVLIIIIRQFFSGKDEKLDDLYEKENPQAKELLPESKQLDIAQKLYSALHGSSFNEDEDAVYRWLGAIPTDLDFYRIAEFYNKASDKENTLLGDIAELFNDNEKAVVNQIFRDKLLTVSV